MDTSKFVDACKAFLPVYPFGTTVTAVALLKFATEQGNGNNPFAAALAEPDPAVRLRKVRNGLNEGWRIGGLPENERAILEIEDTKLKTFFVQPWASMAIERAAAAIGQSVKGGLSPFIRAEKFHASVAVEELSDEDRAELEGRIQNVREMQAAIKPVYATEVRRIATAEWRKLGLTDEQAARALRGLPVMTQLQKLIDMTS
jgi:hypothetical protein